MTYSEARRHDPVVNQKVREMLDKRDEVMEELAPVIDQLMVIAHKYPHSDMGNASTNLDKRVLDAIAILRYEYRAQSSALRGASGNDTFVGNISASPDGARFTQED